MKKEKILEVSEELFFAKRYWDVKLDNIAVSLNIQKPSLYYYFKDKKDLFISTLKFSQKKYINSLKNIVENSQFDNFVKRYLVYPSEKKNLFAIAMHKGYCSDEEIKWLIFNWRQEVFVIIGQFLEKKWINKKKQYLITNMLENLALKNCIKGYCLKYSFEEIAKEIKKFLDI